MHNTLLFSVVHLASVLYIFAMQCMNMLHVFIVYGVFFYKVCTFDFVGTKLWTKGLHPNACS